MDNIQFPAQQLSDAAKTRAWRKRCVDFADSKLHFNYALVRHNILHQKINYDLIAGKLHMDDMELICNPDGIKAGFIPDKIQHYAIMNKKLQVLKGEEINRIFDYRVVVTNPNALSEIENNKRDDMYKALQELVQKQVQDEQQFQAELEKINDYFSFEWQDFRELRGNCLLNHYSRQDNFSIMFNQGFMDAMVIGEEMYQCTIVGGEPVIERLNPMKVRIFKSGYSNKVEDADMIILEDYWSPGRIYDTFYDVLSAKDIKYLETFPDHFSQGAVDDMDNIDDRYGWVNSHMISDVIAESTMFFDPFGQYSDSVSNELLPFDMNGNVRVIRVYWKSRRKIKKIKFFNEEGEEDFTFMPEKYIPNEDNGEEEEIFWINEAWEGTKIGQDIYVNMRPMPIQYNSMTNPSVCHFGIIGSIYNFNDDKPFSLVDMLKPFNYLYDIIHDRLNKMLSRNWGKMVRLDFSKMPAGWEMDKWVYYAKTMGIFIENNFNEGSIGAATGKLAGALNSNSQGVIDADFGNNMQQYINLMEFISMEMDEVAGISKQREGNIANRETVGGVERATLQSSYITEWLFSMHDDIKKRVLECFLETAKIALKGRSKKFQYILPDHSKQIIEIDGDEFAECDYGLVVDNSRGLQELQQKLETLAQAALQNQTLDFSTIMKLYMSASIAEKQRYVENNERQLKEQMQQQQQQQLQQQQQIAQAELQQKQAEMQLKDSINQRDNETKIKVAEINSEAEFAILELKNHMLEAEQEAEQEPVYTQEAKEKLLEQMRQFDAKLQFEKAKLDAEDRRQEEERKLKQQKMEDDYKLKQQKMKDDVDLKKKQLEIQRMKNSVKK